jgi:deazaflavin-dependent oxidoreductase (nitroreductase family)
VSSIRSTLSTNTRIVLGLSWRPDPDDRLTLAKGRVWLLWWHGPVGKKLDRALVRHTGKSPIYQLFAHRDGKKLSGVPLLLQTLGRKTGTTRTTVLPSFAYQGSWVVCGTMAGGPRDPQWVKNLSHHHRATVWVHRRRIEVEGRVLEGPEREAAADWINVHHPSLSIYQRKADQFGRTIPLVMLTPVLARSTRG